MNLLTKTENRRLEFARILANEKSWIKLSDLAKQLNCSDRVLKEDIAYFKTNFTDFTVETSTHGVRLKFKYDKGLKSLYQKLLGDSTTYQFLEKIFFNETLTINEIAESLYVSSSTLYRLVDQINSQLAELDFQILTNPCRVVGDEKRIRYFYYQYFFEKYSRLEWPYEGIDEKAFDELLLFFIRFTEMKVDSAHFNIFKLTSAVNFTRYKNCHFIDTIDIKTNFDEIIPQLDDFADVFQRFEQAFDVTFDNHFIQQLFTQYVQEDFSLNYERLMEKTQKCPRKKEEVDFLNDLLDELSEKHELPIPNREQILLALDNSAHLEYQEPQSGYILYNKNKEFANAIEREFPVFYEHLYDAMKRYRHFLKKPQTEDGIYFFIYTIFTFWENLVPELRKKFDHIRVLVISDRHYSHARMLKDFVQYEFNEQLVIDIYTDIELTQSTFYNLDYDLIITNAVFPDDIPQKIVYIDNVPTHSDLNKIQKALDEIIQQRTDKT